MLYFLPWVLFLLFVILAVPVASMLEKRKMQASYGGGVSDEFTDVEGGDAPMDMEEPQEDGFGGDAEEPLEGFGDENDLGGDAFA
ncbi:MAG: hypothetical protein AB8B91_16715 [Rubripirellula sp.]